MNKLIMNSLLKAAESDDERLRMAQAIDMAYVQGKRDKQIEIAAKAQELQSLMFGIEGT